MITTQISGSLGDQLFQILHLLSYCMKYKEGFYFEKFNNTKTYWTTFFKSLQSFIKESDSNVISINESNIDFIPKKVDIKFIGLFRSHYLFQEYEIQLFRMIDLYEKQTQAEEYYKARFCMSQCVSMHFPNTSLDINYYINALNKLCILNDKTKFTILCFCDVDCRHFIKELHGFFLHLDFREVEQIIQDYNQLLIMSLCDHNIIANNTFSWWGAYFNRNPKKIVIYPKQENVSQNIATFPATWYEV